MPWFPPPAACAKLSQTLDGRGRTPCATTSPPGLVKARAGTLTPFARAALEALSGGRHHCCFLTHGLHQRTQPAARASASKRTRAAVGAHCSPSAPMLVSGPAIAAAAFAVQARELFEVKRSTRFKCACPALHQPHDTNTTNMLRPAPLCWIAAPLLHPRQALRRRASAAAQPQQQHQDHTTKAARGPAPSCSSSSRRGGAAAANLRHGGRVHAAQQQVQQAAAPAAGAAAAAPPAKPEGIASDITALVGNTPMVGGCVRNGGTTWRCPPCVVTHSKAAGAGGSIDCWVEAASRGSECDG